MSENTPRQTRSPGQPGETAGSTSGGRPEGGQHGDRRETLTKATQIIWLVTGILEALIGIRVVLRLLAASPEAGFAQFIYGITGVFVAPFSLLFQDPSAVGAVLELSSLVAMLIYALAAWGLVRILWVVLDESPRHGGGPGAPA